MRAVVIAGSETPESLRLPSSTGTWGEVALVVLVDRGAEHLPALTELGADRAPIVLVGDMDSISPRSLHVLEQSEAEIRVLPRAKDETDLEVALKVALERGADDLVVLAALGGPRLDHLLGTIALLSAPWLRRCRVRLVDDTHEVFLAGGDVEIEGAPGDLVSLIPTTPVVEDVVTEGLAYPLRGERLVQGSTRGVSNALTGRRARVTHGAGDLLIVRYCSPRQAPPSGGHDGAGAGCPHPR